MKKCISILMLTMMMYVDCYTSFFVLAKKDTLLNAYWTNITRDEQHLDPLIEEWYLEIGEQQADTSEKQKKMYKGLPLFSAKDLHRPTRSRNVGIDTNNVGNIMDGRGKGAIGVYKSPNGRYYSVFATVEEGYAALLYEIEIRKTTTIPSRLQLSAFLWGWVLGKQGHLDENSFYYKNALATVGEDSSILSISTEVLAKIIMVGEGTFEAYQRGGVDLRYLIS